MFCWAWRQAQPATEELIIMVFTEISSCLISVSKYIYIYIYAYIYYVHTILYILHIHIYIYMCLQAICFSLFWRFQASKKIPESIKKGWRFQSIGGFNPFEKYARQIGSFPQLGVNIPKMLELPPPRKYYITYIWPSCHISPT